MEKLKDIEALYAKLMANGTQTFPDRHQSFKPEVKKKQGVYVIYNSKDRVVHVGRTYRGREGLFQRLRDHLHGSSSFTNRYLNGDGDKLRKGYTFRYLVVSSARKRALLEAYATAYLCPLHLGLGKSQTEEA